MCGPCASREDGNTRLRVRYRNLRNYVTEVKQYLHKLGITLPKELLLGHPGWPSTSSEEQYWEAAYNLLQDPPDSSGCAFNGTAFAGFKVPPSEELLPTGDQASNGREVGKVLTWLSKKGTGLLKLASGLEVPFCEKDIPRGVIRRGQQVVCELVDGRVRKVELPCSQDFMAKPAAAATTRDGDRYDALVVRSRGSVGHEAGLCAKPCRFRAKCRSGKDRPFCHFCSR